MPRRRSSTEVAAWPPLIAILAALALPVPAPAEDLAAARERAVLLARDGHHAQAGEALRALLERHPDAPGVRADLVAVLEWDGRYGAAAAAAEGLNPDTVADYALLAWARALRGVGDFQSAYAMLAARLTEDGSLTEVREPSEDPGADLAVLAALLLTDLERDDEALELVAEARRRHPESAEAAAAEAYVLRRMHRPVDGLIAARDALALDAGHAEAWRQQVFALADLGAAEQALELAEQRSLHFDAAELTRLRGDRAARRVYWARAHRGFPQRGRLAAANAVSELEALLADPGLNGDARTRARYDHVVALREGERMSDATAAYEALLEDGLHPPPYVLEAAADAYLHERRPREAVALYREVLRDDPWRFNTRMSLFYALIESERFSEALALIDSLADEKPTHLAIDGTGQRVAYWRKLEVDLAAAMARAFANRHGEAQSRLELLATDAPASAQIRRELATLYRWRGWPSRALNEIELAQRYEPEVVAGRLAHIEALIELERFAEADAVIEALYADHPEDPRVERQRQRLDDRRRWLLEVAIEHGSSSGFSEFGARDRQARLRLTAPPIAGHWRPYLFTAYNEGRFPEGSADHDRAGVGVGWRHLRRHAYVEMHRNRSGEAETGVTAGFDWHVDDHWSLALRTDSFSTDIPVRARNHGLDGWKLEGAVRWQAHESLGVYGGWSRLDIADGNVRSGVWLGSDQRLRARAHHLTSGAVELYGSKARREGGPYFNPSREASLGYTVTHDWVTWRRYERVFTQRFVAGAGAYRQSAFGTEATAMVRYEQRWQIGPRLGLSYGAGVSFRPYDGNRERRTSAHLTLQGLL